MDNTQDRLPKELQNSLRVSELFQAIDEYHTERIDPHHQRLRNLRSVFTASDDDLALMLEELTAYSDEGASQLAKPLSIFWKKNEINNKNNEWAIEALVQRLKFSSRDFVFEPLWAPIDTTSYPYGTVFRTMTELISAEATLADYFLTSQMQLRLDYNEVLANGWDEQELKNTVERYFEENVRPLHIVFRGVKFRLISAVRPKGVSVAVQSRGFCQTIFKDV